MAPIKRENTSPATAAASDPAPAAAAGPDDELARLQRENASLRAALSNAGVPVPATDAAGRAHPQRPGDGRTLTQGERSDLELNGITTDVFTGERLVAGHGLASQVEPQTAAAKARVQQYAPKTDPKA